MVEFERVGTVLVNYSGPLPCLCTQSRPSAWPSGVSRGIDNDAELSGGSWYAP
jgi:hypothetical protein